VGFSFGFPITEDVRTAIKAVPATVWAPAAEPDDDIRDGAWGAELTGLLDLTAWPAGSRVIVRSERPHPGANLSLFDTIEGLRHRRHTRIEDRIRQAKAAGLRRLPCKGVAENHAWLECVLAANLVAWSKLLCFADQPALARCEIATYRYRILHIAARTTRPARTTYLRLDTTWTWAKQLALAFTRLRDAFT